MADKKKQGEQKDLERKLLNIFKKNPKKHYTHKQLTKKVIQHGSKEEIAKAINDLKSKGKLRITDTNKLQYIHQQEKGSTPKSTGKVVEGVLDMTLNGSAYLISPDMDQDVYIPQKFTNKAFDGDRVKVALFKGKKGRKPEGEVSEIIARARHEFVGSVQVSNDFGFVVPDHARMNVDVFIPKENLKDVRDGDRVIVRMTHWPEDKKNPYGEIVEKLGAIGNNDIEMKTILIENGFPLKFSQKVMDEVEEISDKIKEDEIAKRRDFRDITTFTIDPEDAKDFDDALSIRKLENGNWEVGVHIADVAYYVKPGTQLDKEAYRRATSVYLVDRVLPMLPERLSNIICSLRPNEEKLCFAAVFEMNDDAEVQKRWFGRTVINSDRRFTYEQVQEIIEGEEGDFKDDILELNKLAHKLRERKFKNGAIAFETVEVKFHIDQMGVPIGVYVKERKEAHMLIEDFMLLANKEVAEFASKIEVNHKKSPFVYRVHDTPNVEKLEEFSLFARKFGYKVNFDTPKQVSESLNRLMQEIKGKPEQDLLEQLAIRSMAKAVYTTKNIGHYGLAFDHYTHFTSPIRRYPDVMVHRLMEEILEKKLQSKQPELEEKCTHSSWMERKAMDAERESIKYKQVEFMMNKIGQEYDGIVTGVVHFGLFVEIIENKCEGLVDIESMREDDFTYNERENSLEGMITGKKYLLGDKVRIRVLKADLEKRRLDYELVIEE